MQQRPMFWRGAATFAAALLGGAVLFSASALAKLKTLHSFCRYVNAPCADGTAPVGPLVMDTAGNLFGTAAGGANHAGVLYELVHEAGKSRLKYKVLHNFCADLNCSDGLLPEPLIIDVAGNLYGVASFGGAHHAGLFFELVRNGSRWKYVVLYNFCDGRKGGCAGGGQPTTKLTYAGAEHGQPYDGASTLYGAGVFGGKYFGGTVYALGSMNGAWHPKSIYDFCKDPACPDGSLPNTLLFDGEGRLVGTTSYGGPNGDGLVFRLTPSSVHPKWDHTVLYGFCSGEGCPDGAHPAGLAIDSSGNIFGTTASGGGNPCWYCGVLYEITSGGVETTLYTFCSQTNCQDGFNPDGTLLIGSDGSLVGTAIQGGKFDRGTVFKWIPSTLQTLYAFCQETNCTDGAGPVGGLLRDATGSLFGTTASGGAYGFGTVFRLTR